MQDNQIVLGVTPVTSLIFDEEFPGLPKVELPAYDIKYSTFLPLWLKLLVDAPRIFSIVGKENRLLKKIVDDFKIDVVISDNRFGLYDARVKSIYLTHQLQMQTGFFSFIANRIHHNYMKHFQEIWVPDFEDEKVCLAGKLSKNTNLRKVRYIGALSRLSYVSDVSIKFDYLCLLSGPEPKRTELEKLLISKARLSGKKICMVRGSKPGAEIDHPDNIQIVDLPDPKQLADLIASSEMIICRSGYSTLMDLYVLKKYNCMLIPTPGQFEQIYLAKYWKEKFNAKVFEESDLVGFEF